MNSCVAFPASDVEKVRIYWRSEDEAHSAMPTLIVLETRVNGSLHKRFRAFYDPEGEFDRAAPETAGSFSMAKAKVYEEEEAAAAPVPKPAGEIEFGEFKTLFEFDFHPHNSEHYWISESK